MQLDIKKAQKYIKNGEKVEEALPIIIQQQKENYYHYSLAKFAYEYLLYSERLGDHVEDSDYKIIQDKVFEIVGKGLLVNDNETDSYVLALHQMREIIAKRLELLTVYADEIEVYEYILNRLEYRYSEPPETPDLKNFVGELIQFIFSEKDNALINYKMKEILAQAPVRMTKSKFFDYIHSSLSIYKGTDKRYLNYLIDVLKKINVPSEVDGYGEEFTEIHHLLSQLKGISLVEMSAETFFTNKLNLKTLSQIIEEYTNSYVDLILVINLLYALLLNSKDNHKDQSLAAFSVISKTQRLWEGETDISEVVMNDLEALEGVQESLHHNILVIEGSIETGTQYLKEKNDSIQKDIELLNKLSKLTSSSFYSKLEEEMEQVEDVLDDTKIYSIAEGFTNYLEDQFKKEDMVVRRAKMSKVLSLLPVSFGGPEEIYNYLLFSFEQANEQERVASIELIQEVMKEYE